MLGCVTPATLLLVSGSARRGSTNAAVIATAAALAPDHVATIVYGSLAELPLYTPDLDAEGVPVDPRVADLRAGVGRADAILVSTPEYAGALPAAMKNLLEWTIGDASTHDKPVAWINAAGPAAPTGAADAHDSLRKVLAYAGARVVEDACARIPIARDMVGDDGLIADPASRDAIAAAVATLVAACAPVDAA
jgi:chromate reductase, NAD(P)H dehydrogenase (quinone)